MSRATSQPETPETADLRKAGDTRRNFFTIASDLAMLTADVATKLASDADTQQILPAHLALRQGLLSPSQVDIIETLLRPGEAVPGYEILGLLGKGGMGVVYRARQKSLDRVVALKTVLVSQLADPAAVMRFEQEAQAVARLMHPHIIAAYDFGRHEGRLFFAMELVEGEDVEKLSERVGPLDESLAWGLLRQAAAGLAHAAKGGVVHRDIKPANLLLVQPPEGFPLPTGMPQVKIADFGLAFLASEEGGLERTRLTMASTTMGSPHYMAPEQLDGGHIDQRTDIYALGATAWQMLVGKPPLAGKTLSQIMSHKLTSEIEMVREVNSRVTEGSSVLVARMLRRDPLQRPANYEELLKSIDALGTSNSAGSSFGETAVMPVLERQVTNVRPPSSQPSQAAAANKRPRWIIPAIVGTAGIAVCLMAASLLLNRPPPTVQRDLITCGQPIALFNGENLRNWQFRSGTWRPGQDDEGGIVLLGASGVISRKLPTAAGSSGPPEYYQIEFGFSFQTATAVELQFDLANELGKRAVLRLTSEGIMLGHSNGDLAPLISDNSNRQPRAFSREANERHSVKLQRQPGGWIVSVDGKDVGTLPHLGSSPESEFRVRVDGGPAWLENFVFEELISP